jgi:type I restriction enzyme S subunit
MTLATPNKNLYPLPDTWRWFPLCEVATIGSRQVLPFETPDKSFNYLALENIESGTGQIVNFSPTPGKDIKSNKFVFDRNHVLYGKLRPYLRKAVTPDFEGVSATDLLPIKPDNSRLDRHYLKWWLLSPVILDYVTGRQTGVKMPRLRSDDLDNLPIPLPPIDEQRKIVDKLASSIAQTRTARAALECIPVLLKAFRQSVLAAAFRGELTERVPDDEPAAALLERIRAERRQRWEESLRARGKDPAKAVYEEPSAPDTANLPELPEGWAWTTLDHLLGKIEAGHSFKAQGRPAEEGEFGVIKVSAMTWGKFLPEENKALLPGTDPGSTPRVCKGDLLISRANTVELVGAVVLVEQDYPNLLLSDKSLRLVPLSTEISKEFLLYALRTQSVRNVFEGEATGVTESMRNISQDKIRIAPIALPPLSEQAKIIEKIKLANAQSDAIERAIATGIRRLDELEQSAIAKAFRDEL